MGETLTAEEVRSEAIAAMGSPLGGTYHSLSDEVSWLHLKWNDFRELFADRETVDLLNSAAPAYFHELQRQTWEDVLLHLCRVTDPPLSAGKPTLTIRRLPGLVSDEMVRVELQLLVNDAVQKAIFARDWRTAGWHTKNSIVRNRWPPHRANMSKMHWPPFEWSSIDLNRPI